MRLSRSVALPASPAILLVNLVLLFPASYLTAQQVPLDPNKGILLPSASSNLNGRQASSQKPLQRPLTASAVPAVVGSAVNVVLDFDALKCEEYVDTYYSGAEGSEGTGPGPDYSITFSPNTLVATDNSLCPQINATNEPSFPNSIFFLSGSAATMNVPAGFTGGFSFYYSAYVQGGFINVWSGLNGTGTLLATLNLPVTGGCSAQPNYCIWNPIGVSFSGTAQSVDFGGTENYIAFDNITLGASLVVNPGKSAGNPSDQPGSCNCGDPINIGTGNLFEQINDYQTTGYNKLAFTRYYNSLGNAETFASALGLKWRSTYDRYIRIISATTVTANAPTASR